jgi:hypothetical protein
MNSASIARRLREGFGSVTVDELAPDTFRILIPGGPLLHDTLAIGMERYGEGWQLTDGGQLAFLLDDEYERIAEIMQCAGAPFTPTQQGLVMPVERDSQLAEAIHSFVHYLAAAPTVWHALDCARSDATARPVSVDVMAREMRGNITERFGERVVPYLHLKYRVVGRGEAYAVPLAVAVKGTRRPPILVSSFIDTLSPARAVTSAKVNATFMLNVVGELSIPKYLVVRGPDDAVEHFARFYDPFNVTTLSSERLGPLYEDVRAGVSEFINL